MAGITSVPVKLKLFDTSRTSPLFSSTLYKLPIPRSLDFHSSFSFSLPAYATVRHGCTVHAFGKSGNSGNSRRFQKDDDDERALDLSTLRSNSVRLIDQNQNMVGVVSRDQALQMADDAELDLVIVSAEADPPVVKIMDYRYKIDQHDYSVRLKSARKFLTDGDKVKVVVSLKGREKEFRNIAIELIRRFQNDIGKLGTEEARNFRERNIFLTLAPNKVTVPKTQETPKKKEESTADEASIGVEA